ncbi:MAG: inositol monophosphatase [Chromatiales bacterium]|nr:inositol monophosphatase [Chromatiales bacterium]
MQAASLNIAIRAARQAGRVLLRNFDRVEDLAVSVKGHNDFVSRVDHEAEAAIIHEIHKAYPEHAIFAEESGQQAGNEYEWIIDPLDGTTNYLHGVPQFGVSIALRVRGRLDQAVVYDPLREEMFTASRGGGAYLNDRRIRVTKRITLDGALIGTGFPYRAGDADNVDRYLQIFRALLIRTAGLRRPGSASLDLAWVASGRYDAFWEFGLAPWDFAAGTLLVREAGGIVTDVDGGEGFFETGNIVAGNLKVHRELLRTMAGYLGGMRATTSHPPADTEPAQTTDPDD